MVFNLYLLLPGMLSCITWISFVRRFNFANNSLRRTWEDYFLRIISFMQLRHYARNLKFPSSNTAWKKPVFKVFSGPYFPLFSFSQYSVRMRENTDQKNFKYRHLLRSVSHFFIPINLVNFRVLDQIFCSRLFIIFSETLRGREKNSWIYFACIGVKNKWGLNILLENT